MAYASLTASLISYGFAHGLMASLVARFGGVPHVALAAGGRDRALADR
jgi:hypothetical protein